MEREVIKKPILFRTLGEVKVAEEIEV